VKKRYYGGSGFLWFCYQHQVPCSGEWHERDPVAYFLLQQLPIFWRSGLVVD